MTKSPMGRSDQIPTWIVVGIFSLLWIYIGAVSLPQGRVQVASTLPVRDDGSLGDALCGARHQGHTAVATEYDR